MIATAISVATFVVLAILVGLLRGVGKHIYDKLFKSKVDSEIDRRRKGSNG